MATNRIISIIVYLRSFYDRESEKKRRKKEEEEEEANEPRQSERNYPNRNTVQLESLLANAAGKTIA